MIVVVSGMDIKDVLQQCRDLEDRDFECIRKLQKQYDTHKSFRYQSGTRSKFDKHHFQSFEDSVKWNAVYRSKEGVQA